ncbi:MAG TPA: tetratricopeptide repeat protein [Usitatibacter sp.]|nr:tetratricopeptide repeat protein [Usitatibacter sp.]
MAAAGELQQRAMDALRSGRLDEAERCYRELLAAFRHPGVLSNLGLVLVAQRRDAEAVEVFEQSLAARPGDANTRLALANALIQCGRAAEALARCDELVAAVPSNRDARHNRAVALRALNRNEEAARELQSLLDSDPTDADAEFNLALAELMLGRHASAWRHYEARWRGRGAQPPLPGSSAPVWRPGESLAGRRVLVQAEQGLGDSLQFLRWVPRLDRACARVDLQVQAELVALMRRTWPGRSIDALGAAPDPRIERRIGLMSLPLALGVLADEPIDAYLHADPARVEAWRAAWPAASGPRLGIAWRGNPAKRHDPQRSIPLAALQPWIEAVGARSGFVVALQRDANAEERDWLARFPHVAVPGTRLRDFEDTAAVMESLDQVVSVDTSVIHLAGALGRPSVVLLKFSSDWRWGIDRPDGATYASVRTLRQPAPGQWEPVVRALIERLP